MYIPTCSLTQTGNPVVYANTETQVPFVLVPRRTQEHKNPGFYFWFCRKGPCVVMSLDDCQLPIIFCSQYLGHMPMHRLAQDARTQGRFLFSNQEPWLPSQISGYPAGINVPGVARLLDDGRFCDRMSLKRFARLPVALQKGRLPEPWQR